MKKILLYGVGTYKNKGVEAIIKSTIDQIDNNYQVTVASLYNKENNKRYNDRISKYMPHISNNAKISDIYISDHNKLKNIQMEILEEIKHNDICISCGGDNYSYNVSNWLYTIDSQVKKEGKKLVLWGASLYDEINDIDLINDMNLFDVLYIRESISYDAIKNYVNDKKLLLCPDPAFSLKPIKIELDKWYENRKIIGINLSSYTINGENIEAYEAIISLIKYILEHSNYSINLIPHVTQDESNDMLILNKIKDEFIKEERVHLESNNYNCQEIKYVISKCQFLIASRTHASIAGYSQCIPTLVIGYSVKSKGIAKDIFGTYENYVISYKDITTKNFIKLYKWFQTNDENIRKRLNDVIPKMNKEAKKAFIKVISKLKENERLEICERENCIGCRLCEKSCHQHAISIKKDELGFCYPSINIKKCVGCNICKNICPVNTEPKETKSLNKCYACKAKDKNVQASSSSGGFFQVLAKMFIRKKNGIVYGVTNKNNNTHHIRITSEKDLIKIRGSKYTQSSIFEIIEQIKKDINDNKNILFSGTPCQIMAIANIAKNYNNIYYVSVICHGVMNDNIVKKILSYRKYNKKTQIEYHRKDYGWSNPTIKLESKYRKKILSYGDSYIMTLYLNNYILRKSCYNCKFKGTNNVADIIMGDYWGVMNYHKDFYDENGISAIILRNNKSHKLINDLDVLSNIDYEVTKYESILEGNALLDKSAPKPIKRYKIHKIIETDNIDCIYENIKLKQDFKRQKYEMEKYYQTQIDNLSNQLMKIKTSKRWKLIDGIFNKIDKLKK